MLDIVVADLPQDRHAALRERFSEVRRDANVHLVSLVEAVAAVQSGMRPEAVVAMVGLPQQFDDQLGLVELFLYLTAAWPDTRLLLLDPDIGEPSRSVSGALFWLPAHAPDVAITEVVTRMMQGAEGFACSLRNATFDDFFNLALTGRWTGGVAVRNLRRAGAVRFDAGYPVHVSFDDQWGLEALAHLLATEDGSMLYLPPDELPPADLLPVRGTDLQQVYEQAERLRQQANIAAAMPAAPEPAPVETAVSPSAPDGPMLFDEDEIAEMRASGAWVVDAPDLPPLAEMGDGVGGTEDEEDEDAITSLGARAAVTDTSDVPAAVDAEDAPPDDDAQRRVAAVLAPRGVAPVDPVGTIVRVVWSVADGPPTRPASVARIANAVQALLVATDANTFDARVDGLHVVAVATRDGEISAAWSDAATPNQLWGAISA